MKEIFLYYCDDCGTVKMIPEKLKPGETFKVRHCDACHKKGTTAFLPVALTVRPGSIFNDLPLVFVTLSTS